MDYVERGPLPPRLTDMDGPEHTPRLVSATRGFVWGFSLCVSGTRRHHHATPTPGAASSHPSERDWSAVGDWLDRCEHVELEPAWEIPTQIAGPNQLEGSGA